MGGCLPACDMRSAVDLGPGHPEACARNVCKQCFTDSHRVVEADNEQSLIRGRPCFYFGQEQPRSQGLFPGQGKGPGNEVGPRERQECAGLDFVRGR